MVFKVVDLLACAEDSDRVIAFWWILAYVGIFGNEVVDGVARVAGGLSYRFLFGLSYVDTYFLQRSLGDPVQWKVSEFANLSLDCPPPLQGFPDCWLMTIPIENLVFEPGPGIMHWETFR